MSSLEFMSPPGSMSLSASLAGLRVPRGLICVCPVPASEQGSVRTMCPSPSHQVFGSEVTALRCPLFLPCFSLGPTASSHLFLGWVAGGRSEAGNIFSCVPISPHRPHCLASLGAPQGQGLSLTNVWSLFMLSTKPGPVLGCFGLNVWNGFFFLPGKLLLVQ